MYIVLQLCQNTVITFVINFSYVKFNFLLPKKLKIYIVSSNFQYKRYNYINTIIAQLTNMITETK